MLRRQVGFTLVEIIIGMVVLAISLTLISGILGPMYVKSADPWHQVRASELGQGLMNEILSRSFDENSSRSGSLLRCYYPEETQRDGGAVPCSTAWGADPGEGGRDSYDDVDDYHGLTLTGTQIISSLYVNPDSELRDAYLSYTVAVTVTFGGSELGLSENKRAKRVDVIVTTPTGFDIEFTSYKGNW